jgi:hypothetical protein
MKPACVILDHPPASYFLAAFLFGKNAMGDEVFPYRFAFVFHSPRLTRGSLLTNEKFDSIVLGNTRFFNNLFAWKFRLDAFKIINFWRFRLKEYKEYKGSLIVKVLSLPVPAIEFVLVVFLPWVGRKFEKIKSFIKEIFREAAYTHLLLMPRVGFRQSVLPPPTTWQEKKK